MNKVKTQRAKGKSVGKKSRVFFYYFLSVLVFFFVFLNIYSSQTISSLYFLVANERYPAAVEFIQRIRSLPDFSFFLAINKKIYGQKLQEDVFAQENQKKQQIAELEAILEKNPKARDALLRLSALYNELGNKIKEKQYWQKAKEVDPNLN